MKRMPRSAPSAPPLAGLRWLPGGVGSLKLIKAKPGTRGRPNAAEGMC